MSNLRIKVCGMTQTEQLDQLVEIGVNFAGFIFYPGSPRFVLNKMTTDDVRKENRINKVGVFVNADTNDVFNIVDECNLQMVQLHGDETPEYCERISSYVRTMKAFRVSENDNIEEMIRPYIDACNMFLFDTAGAAYGGTGKKFDWEQLKGIKIPKPFFLSGGIGPDDVENLKEFANEGLFAIDINSKFETSPGIKDMDKIKTFIKELNS